MVTDERKVYTLERMRNDKGELQRPHKVSQVLTGGGNVLRGGRMRVGGHTWQGMREVCRIVSVYTEHEGGMKDLREACRIVSGYT